MPEFSPEWNRDRLKLYVFFCSSIHYRLSTNKRWDVLKRLELTVNVDNEAAIRLYKRCDFEVEGTHRADTFRGGKYVDTFFMARLKPGWLPLTND